MSAPWANSMLRSCLLLAAAAGGGVVEPAATPYFEQDIAASDALRVGQAREYDRYIAGLLAEHPDRRRLLAPDYSSPEAYAESMAAYRDAFARSMGFPPPGAVPAGEAQLEQLGEDSFGVYHRLNIPVRPGLHMKRTLPFLALGALTALPLSAKIVRSVEKTFAVQPGGTLRVLTQGGDISARGG